MIRQIVRGTYDLQKLRIQVGLRLVATFKVKLGQEPSTKEKELDKESIKLLDQLRHLYNRITDGVAINKKNLDARLETLNKEPEPVETIGLISTFTEFKLVENYLALLNAEKDSFKLLEHELDSVPIYTDYLKPIRGIGPAMAGVIVSEIDIHKSEYSSSIHKYAGLDVVILFKCPNCTKYAHPEDSDMICPKCEAGVLELVGEGRSKKEHHLIEVEYVDKNGKTATRKSITFNPFLKTKLIGVLGPSFLRAGDNKYSKIYKDYKFRLQNMEKHKGKSKLHIHNMSVRYMVKFFLIDLYAEWRAKEGLPVTAPYHERKLGIVHHKKAS